MSPFVVPMQLLCSSLVALIRFSTVCRPNLCLVSCHNLSLLWWPDTAGLDIHILVLRGPGHRLFPNICSPWQCISEDLLVRFDALRLGTSCSVAAQASALSLPASTILECLPVLTVTAHCPTNE